MQTTHLHQYNLYGCCVRQKIMEHMFLWYSWLNYGPTREVYTGIPYLTLYYSRALTEQMVTNEAP